MTTQALQILDECLSKANAEGSDDGVRYLRDARERAERLIPRRVIIVASGPKSEAVRPPMSDEEWLMRGVATIDPLTEAEMVSALESWNPPVLPLMPLPPIGTRADWWSSQEAGK